MWSLCRFIRVFLTLLLIGLLLNAVGRPALAESSHPDLILLIHEPNPSSRSHLELFSSDEQVSKEITIFDQGSVLDVTPDLQWAVFSDIDRQTQADTLSYERIGSAPTSIPIDDGYNVMNAKIDSNSRYLGYTLANVSTEQWILGVVNLATGQRVEFSSPINMSAATAAAPVTTIVGVASTIGWNAAGTQMYLFAYTPFSEADLSNGIFALDLSNAPFGAPTGQPFPALTQIVSSGSLITQIAMSPDLTKMAFLYNDPANPPANYDSAASFSITVNSLTVVDLSAMKQLFAVQAGTGQAFESMTWTQDGAKILVSGGTYDKTNYVVNPRVYTVDLDSAQMTAGPALISDPTGIVTSLTACEDTLFYKVTYIGGSSFMPYLHLVPLSDLKSHSGKLSAGQDFRLLGCA